MPNGYQISKARKITKFLLSCETSLTRYQLAQAVALMGADEWRKVSFAAGEAIADLDAKAVVLSLLRDRTIHQVGK